MIYLDYAAATPICKKARLAMEPFFTDRFYNPSAAYTPARETRAVFENARHDIAKVLGANQNEIIITAGATESINLALGSFSNVLTSQIEHSAVLACAGKNLVKVDARGRIDLDDLKNKIDEKTELVSIGYANSEIGVVQPLKEAAEIICAERARRSKRDNKTPIYLHTDASAAAGFLDLNVARLGVDLMTLNSGKCYGPKQVGALYVRAGVELRPLVHGGGQEMGLRSGTENVAGAVGFAAALAQAEKKRKSEVGRIKILRDDFESFIIGEFAGARINSASKHRLPGIFNFSIEGLDGERAVFALDFAGVMCATGSACAANSGARSHVLTAIGLTDAEADGSLRISLGRFTTQPEIEQAKKIFKKTLPKELEISQKQGQMW
ncbi:cysteine desulfurase [Candidatus Saccharibacteria bacterium]|nr:cysteine desulfurase [Candidatus Saccharibacteria bacterium]